MGHHLGKGILGVSFLMLYLLNKVVFAAELPIVDQGRGEWTLVVIPDTQGYTEPWPEQGFAWSEVKETFEWLPTVRDQLNIQIVQSVGDMGEFYIGHNAPEWGRVQYLTDI